MLTSVRELMLGRVGKHPVHWQETWKSFAWLSRLVMRSETVECHYDTLFERGG